MKIIGHRGAKGLAPENTLASFSKALEHNVDEIEFDVRITKDNVPVMEHDKWLHNQAGERFRVGDFTLAQLRKHKPELTTLGQAIEAVNRAVPLYVEIKPKEPTQPVIDCIQTYLAKGWKPTDFRFGSFDSKVLRELHNALPAIPLIVIGGWSGVRTAIRARRLGATRISMNQRWIWSGYVRAVTKQGYQLYSYTLNDSAKAHRLAKYGLYGAVTDYPDIYELK
jgi:glycerophosphoryl diester phosphodiesterase